jgi:tRNA pseudouridine38-40 synthase
MRNIRFTIAYDGTAFHGWQWQPQAPTVQGALQDVARRLTQEEARFFAAGRTDAGVHASGQVVHFRTRSALSAAEFRRAFNALLPPEIRVVEAEEVGPDFHARWKALAKTYQYRIFRGRVVPPAVWRYVLHYPFPLDEQAMARAARLFEGEHDFTSFAASSGSEEDDADRLMTRQIYTSAFSWVDVAFDGTRAPTDGAAKAEEHIGAEGAAEPVPPRVASESYEMVYTARGRSFLRYMVRKMVGTLLEVGRGRLRPEDISALFALKDRTRSGPTVPPQGLCLVSVEYPEVWRPGSPPAAM